MSSTLGLFLGGIIIVSVTFTETRVEVVYREPSNSMYAVNPPRPVPDRIWKEVYEVGEDGKIHHVETIDGKHEPSHYVSESITFGDQDITDITEK